MLKEEVKEKGMLLFCFVLGGETFLPNCFFPWRYSQISQKIVEEILILLKRISHTFLERERASPDKLQDVKSFSIHKLIMKCF